MAVDPEQPFNREEQYLADIAGQNVEVPPCPWNRKEAYLAEIGGRLDTMDDRISALATDLSFKGSVATENDLPADAAVGDTYITEDTGVMYVWVGEEWVAINDTGGGGGGVVELTSADYNYHYSGNTDDTIAPWLLNDGIYLINGSTTPVQFCREFPDQFNTIDGKAFLTVTSHTATNFFFKEWMVILVHHSSIGYSRPSVAGAYKNSNNVWNRSSLQRSSGSYNSDILLASDIQDNLTTNGSVGSKQVLSANQGSVLKDIIDKKIPTFYTTNDISEGFTEARLYAYKNLVSEIDGSRFYNALANGGFVLCQIVNNDVDIAYTVVGYTIPYENSTTGFDHYPPTAYITNGLATMELSFTSAIPTSFGHFTCSAI